MSDEARLIETDQPGLMRDEHSHGIISTDGRALHDHRVREKQFRSTQKKINSIDVVKEEMDGLKREMTEIRNLLAQLVKKEE